MANLKFVWVSEMATHFSTLYFLEAMLQKHPIVQQFSVTNEVLELFLSLGHAWRYVTCVLQSTRAFTFIRAYTWGWGGPQNVLEGI